MVSWTIWPARNVPSAEPLSSSTTIPSRSNTTAWRAAVTGIWMSASGSEPMVAGSRGSHIVSPARGPLTWVKPTRFTSVRT
jgi:hypothetical protein